MALFTRQQLRERASVRTATRAASSVLAEGVREAQKSQKAFDVFLSHAYADAAVILGLKLTLESHGVSVYVDWVDDPHVDRSKVDRSTATHLRNRMRACKSLLYAVSPNAAQSKWMPWELGYFDGFNGKVALVPVVDTPTSAFHGQEYLSLYPYIDEATSNVDGRLRLWVNTSDTEYRQMSTWLQAA